MQTNFTAEQLQNPHTAEANKILRNCVHCGFCTATCPTYVLLGDELDSPRGRIYLIKNMLEKNEAATKETVKHIDRCLSCLACMTTCPSGVNYMHLIDQARVHVEKTYNRPIFEKILRAVLGFAMPRPRVFRTALEVAKIARPFSKVISGMGFTRIAALLSLVPAKTVPSESLGPPGVYPAEGEKRGRVALLMGCVQSVIEPSINAATIRLLTRLGYEVVVSAGESCCGSLTHHMGKEADAIWRARRNVHHWANARVEAVIITASGCGTTIKDYGFMLRFDPVYAARAAVISAKAKDIVEFLSGIELPAASQALRVTYHSACSMQHGQNMGTKAQTLLRNAGFTVQDIPEGHLCCGSAGTYNIMQPEIATRLRDRKIENIKSTNPQVIATGNIGCITQLATSMQTPILHTVELLDWAYGGPRPDKIKHLNGGPKNG
ncbi:MAG TPA: glycolate oxidase subunit GlcF [Aestuariivirga sp.]